MSPVRRGWWVFATALCAAILAGCAADVFRTPLERADALAADHGWNRSVISAGLYDLTIYEAARPVSSDTLTIYIEGDGNTFVNRYQPSADPTPRRPSVLALAVLHPDDAAAYVARPCQYTAASPGRNCRDARLWVLERYGEPVIASVSRAIDVLKGRAEAVRVVLVGQSGGGAVAVLVAARRDDVARIVTLGGNLDHATWTRLDGLTPLTGSLNPVDVARDVQHIPQVHYVGAEDDVVPPAVARAYAARMTDRSNTRIVVLDGVDHDCCYVDMWPALLVR